VDRRQNPAFVPGFFVLDLLLRGSIRAKNKPAIRGRGNGLTRIHP